MKVNDTTPRKCDQVKRVLYEVLPYNKLTFIDLQSMVLVGLGFACALFFIEIVSRFSIVKCQNF